MCEQCRAFDDDDEETDALAHAFMLRQKAGQAPVAGVRPMVAPVPQAPPGARDRPVPGVRR